MYSFICFNYQPIHFIIFRFPLVFMSYPVMYDSITSNFLCVCVTFVYMCMCGGHGKTWVSCLTNFCLIPLRQGLSLIEARLMASKPKWPSCFCHQKHLGSRHMHGHGQVFYVEAEILKEVVIILGQQDLSAVNPSLYPRSQLSSILKLET